MTEWNDADHDFLDELIQRLEDAWRTAGAADLAQFVPVADHPIRERALVALIQVDQELRWRHGQRKTVEEYLAEWPELQQKPACIHELQEAQRLLEADTRTTPPAAPAETQDFAPPDQPRAIRIRCPHCHHPVEILDCGQVGDVKCPSCGSAFNLAAGAPSILPSPSGRGAGGEGAPRKIAHFELLELLGEGSFGSVWKARDTKLNRIVAIKIPRRGQVLPGDVERFVREAQAPAELHHPNVVAVFEVGQEGDLVYIVSEFIEGRSLDKWLEAQGRRLTDREAAKLCVTIAEALDYAHGHGVVHRDLKPSNIMMDCSGQPHLMDFGLAKRAAGEITMTVEGAILGTPAYMSPEQARGEGSRADARSDVYSLGVILFELLTGERPFRGDLRILLRQVAEDEAPAARKLNSRISRDLETVSAKCLEKSPARRYASAADLGDDLRHFLAGEPIHARPVGRAERLWRWCKRKPVVAGLSAAAALLVVLVAVVASIGYVTTSHARHRAEIALAGETTARCNTERQLLRAEWLLYASNIKSAWRELEANDLVVASHYLDSCRADFRGWEYDYLQTLVSKNQLKGHSGAVSSVAFSPDGKRIVSGSDDNTLRVWDAATGQETLVLKGSVGAHMLLLSGTTDPNAGVTCVVFSSDGKRIVGGNRDGTLDDLGLDATGKAEPGEDVRHFRQEIPPTESG